MSVTDRLDGLIPSESHEFHLISSNKVGTGTRTARMRKLNRQDVTVYQQARPIEGSRWRRARAVATGEVDLDPSQPPNCAPIGSNVRNVQSHQRVQTALASEP